VADIKDENEQIGMDLRRHSQSFKKVKVKGGIDQKEEKIFKSYLDINRHTDEVSLPHERHFLSDVIFNDTVTKLRSAGCVFAEEEARLLISEARTIENLASMIEHRAAGLPLEHIIGWAEFCGLRIEVDPGVFVPRRRTEFLALQTIKISRPGAVVVDMCCGSGAVGAVLAKNLDQIVLYAVDIDRKAVLCASRNLDGTFGHVLEGDLFQPLPANLRGRVEVLVANVPYVPTEAIGALPPEARLHEALVALDGGKDGLDIQRQVANAAPLWLAPGGHLLIETSERQAAKTAEIFTASGLSPRIVHAEELDATVVIGMKPAR
jgi:release factor glutamine methyltransferase